MTQSPKPLRLLLCGMGNVHRNFLRILHTQSELLRERHGLSLIVTGVTDSSGAVYSAKGLDSQAILAAKAAGKGVASLKGGQAGMDASALLDTVPADMLLEATPVNLQHGEPGLSTVLEALRCGLPVVLANKGPLALGYEQIMQTAADNKVRVKFSACVGGALPTINIGQRDLAGARVTRVEAMVNGTCQGILRMMEDGHSFDDALAEMRRRGVVEADPSLDIDGWDEAVKLVIIANAVLRRPTTLKDLTVSGIRDLTTAMLHDARARNERYVLLGTADPDGDDWRFAVRAEALPAAHPLARMSGEEMGVVYHTDIAGTISATSAEADATPTAAAMLRDVISLAGKEA
jgi:homoserine dehydrogenase